MTSLISELLTQMIGFLTSLRFIVSTVFVDHVSDYTYSHLQVTQRIDATMEGNVPHERHTHEHGVTVKCHHVDNGHFSDKCFVDLCFDKDQKLFFCEVGTHLQKKFVENQIKYLNKKERTLLICAKHRLLVPILPYFSPTHEK